MGTIVIPSEAPKPKPSRATERIRRYACAPGARRDFFLALNGIQTFSKYGLLTYDW